MLIDNDINIYSILDRLGLFISEKSGGFYDPFFSGQFHLDQSSCTSRYFITYPHSDQITFFNEVIFLKTLLETEASFNIRLFV